MKKADFWCFSTFANARLVWRMWFRMGYLIRKCRNHEDPELHSYSVSRLMPSKHGLNISKRSITMLWTCDILQVDWDTSINGLSLCRHQNLSLEMLLKLVRVFGSVIYSTISASSSVGVDIEAEQRYGSNLSTAIFIFNFNLFIF